MSELHQTGRSMVNRHGAEGRESLVGKHLPDIALAASNGETISLAKLDGITVLYIYPKTGRPDQASPPNWNTIPGASGCTPQACSYRDQFDSLRGLGLRYLFGISTQDSDYQKEAVARLHLPFPLLSDRELAFTNALKLPTFEVEEVTFMRRMSMIIRDGVILKVFYPILHPERDAMNIVQALLGIK